MDSAGHWWLDRSTCQKLTDISRFQQRKVCHQRGMFWCVIVAKREGNLQVNDSLENSEGLCSSPCTTNWTTLLWHDLWPDIRDVLLALNKSTHWKVLVPGVFRERQCPRELLSSNNRQIMTIPTQKQVWTLSLPTHTKRQWLQPHSRPHMYNEHNGYNGYVTQSPLWTQQEAGLPLLGGPSLMLTCTLTLTKFSHLPNMKGLTKRTFYVAAIS